MPQGIPTAPPRILRGNQKSGKDGTRIRTPLEILTAGFIAGAVSRTCTAPFDRLRSLMAAGGTTTLKNADGSILNGLKSMYRAGGLRCMWQGNLANIVQVGPESAFLFFANDILTGLYKTRPDEKLSVGAKFQCGALAGIISMTAVYPMYVVQNRMMVAKEGLYTSIVDCVVKTYRKEGARAFLQGYGPSFVRIIPYKGIDLTGYHLLRETFVAPNECPTTVQSLTFGAVASSISQTVTHPLLLARTKLQCQGDAMGRPIKYLGMFDAIQKTFMKGFTDPKCRSNSVRATFNGIVMLWSGWAPSMAKNVPAIAIQFAVYEKSLRVLDCM